MNSGGYVDPDVFNFDENPGNKTERDAGRDIPESVDIHRNTLGG